MEGPAGEAIGPDHQGHASEERALGEARVRPIPGNHLLGQPRESLEEKPRPVSWARQLTEGRG